jgi:hypothetical protein
LTRLNFILKCEHLLWSVYSLSVSQIKRSLSCDLSVQTTSWLETILPQVLAHYIPQSYYQSLHVQRPQMVSVPLRWVSSSAHWMHVRYLKGSSICQNAEGFRIVWWFIQIYPTWVLMCCWMITSGLVGQKLGI